MPPNPYYASVTNLVGQFTEQCIDEYDQHEGHDERPDFLAWLRREAAKGKPMSEIDIVNHLSNNL